MSGNRGSFQTFSIGRASDADIRLDVPEVSRRQAELTLTADNRYYLIDCGSGAGTRRKVNGVWESFTQGYVTLDDELEFGGKRFGFDQLIRTLPSQRPTPEPVYEPLSVRPVRKTSTGEIIR